MIPREILAHFATRASTIEERLTAPFAQMDSRHEQIEARISRWAELAAKGDRKRLKRSLHWRGIDLDRICPALGEVFLPPDAPLPEWTKRFSALVEAALAEHSNKADTTPANERVAVMSSFARVAAASLRSAIPAHARVNVAEGALAALDRSLLLRLSRVAGSVLAHEYYLYSWGDSRAGGDPASRPQRFADHLLQPPVPRFLIERPVLARLITLVCDNWHETALELLERLAADRHDLVEQFCECRDPGPLIDIQVGDADVHDGHREVVILVFEDGFRIVYKPRSMALDHAFYNFVHWLNRKGLSPSLRSPAVLCRDEYGWAEFIAYRPAADAAELALFYERAGALACLAYLMGSSDLHRGNVIAHGSYPVVIDLETMLRANPRNGALPEPSSSSHHVDQGSVRSVLTSMLLPLTHRLPLGIYTDLSAIGAEPENYPKSVTESDASNASAWLPIHGAPLKLVLRDHASIIEEGFVSAYQFIDAHREALLSGAGPLAMFNRCAIRVVLRDTSLYFQLLRHSIDPSVLRDSVDRHIALERLNHVVSIADSAPSFVDMITCEQAALIRLDVPRFLVMTDETDLRDAAGLVAADVMERTPLAEMRQRIESMSDGDLLRQREDIRWSLIGRIADTASVLQDAASPSAPANLPNRADLIVAAERLAEDLLVRAKGSNGTAPSWRGLVYLNVPRCFTSGDAVAGFADGALGVATFFAALFRVTGNIAYRESALSLSLRYLRPSENAQAYNGHITGGITTGLGGLFYAAALIASLAESSEVLDTGLDQARMLAARTIAEEKDLSLGDGLAGTLLGIAALRHLADDTSLEDIAAGAVAKLRNAKPLAGTGLLTGQAGVVLAAKVNGIDLPLLEPSAPSPANWAEGTLGLSLAALALDPGARHPLNFFTTLASAPIPADDSFAFGSAGEADALLWASTRLDQPELRRAALRRIAATVKRARLGTPRLLGGAFDDDLRPPHILPGLFHGSAGIGYTLLRLAEPDSLPGLAVFELPRCSKNISICAQ